MDSKGGFRIVGKSQGERPSSEAQGKSMEQDLMPTGFHYLTPEPDDTLSGRRSYSHMVILPMYILRELLKGVILSAAVFSIILIAFFASQVMRDGIGVYTMAKVLPNFLPLICPFVLPLAIITGILICYSRLSKDNEILAAYAGGVAPIWLMLPAIMTSIIAIFITLTLNEVALLPAIRNIERLVTEDQVNILRHMIQRPGNITVQAGEEYLAMSKLDPARDPLGRASLDITRFAVATPEIPKEEGSIWSPFFPHPTKRMVARDHEVQDFSDDDAREMTMKMHVTKPILQDLHISDINRSFIAYGESGEERIVLGGRPDVTIHSNRSSFWPILMLSDTRRDAENKIRELEAINMESLPATQREAAARMLIRQREIVTDRTGEINMRLALSFSCLAFAALGIPLGMRTRGSLVNSFVWGIATAGIFFLALKSAEMQVSRGILPYWIIWIPDLLVVVTGIVLWFVNTRRS